MANRRSFGTVSFHSATEISVRFGTEAEGFERMAGSIDPTTHVLKAEDEAVSIEIEMRPGQPVGKAGGFGLITFKDDGEIVKIVAYNNLSKRGNKILGLSEYTGESKPIIDNPYCA